MTTMRQVCPSQRKAYEKRNDDTDDNPWTGSLRMRGWTDFPCALISNTKLEQSPKTLHNEH